MQVTTRSREDTEALGERIGRAARAGDVIALWGELGAGKTTLVRGIARGLGIDPREVTSPTFIIVHEHEGGRLPLFHVDMYRVSPAETGSIGWEEALASAGVTAIEWPDRVERTLPADRIDVRIEHAGGSERRIRIAPVGAASLAIDAAA
jgi:tRNA threonylcarbamoyladenosine biosynthesis protein TsaE